MLKQQDLFTNELHDVPPYMPTDIVTDSFGNECRYAELHTASDGTTFADEGAFEEYQSELWDEQIEQFLDDQAEWIDDYVQSDDYGSEYFYLVSESYAHRGCDAVEKWIRDELGEIPQNIVDYIHNNVLDYADSDCCYEYSSTSYPVQLDSFAIGEYEGQIELASCNELQDIPLNYLANHGELKRHWLSSRLIAHNITIEHEFELRCNVSNLGYPADDLELWSLCLIAGKEHDAGRMPRMEWARYTCPMFYVHVNTGMRWDYGLGHDAMSQCVADAFESCEVEIPESIAEVLLNHGAELPQ